jgi:O-antigen/teichoic acid export membrane protein
VRKYLNTISAFQFYQLVRYSALILTGIVFTKTALSQSAIGEYETFVFLAGAVSFFWLNGLLKALLPLSSNSKHSKTNLFSAFVVIQFFSILAAIFLFFLQPIFSKFLLNHKAIPCIELLFVFIIFGIPANLVEYYYLIKKQNYTIIKYGSISFSIQFILVVLPAIMGYGIQMSLKGLVLSSLLRYLWFWIVMISNAEIHFSSEFVRQHLKLGGPLVIAAFLSGSAQFIDGFIVTSKFNEESFAIFRYGARELPLAMLLANALSNAMLPEFANKEKLIQNLEKLKKSVEKLMHFLFPLTAILLVISKPLFPILFNADFTDSATIFNIYLLLIISRLLQPQTILNGLKISKPIMSASLFEMVINVGLSLVLVNWLGIPGIALATFIAYLFEKIYLALVVKHKLKIRVSAYLPAKIYLFYSIGILIIFATVEYLF